VPLSVSADKIASPAMRCAVILGHVQRMRGREAVERSGSGLVCEAYPDPALHFWTDDDPASLATRESYKGPERSRRRAELAAILARRVPLDDPHGLLDRCALEAVYLDALVCALVARAAMLGQTEVPVDVEDVDAARIEGWIHLPRAPVSGLIRPSAD
jgi:hypothetical protein